MHNLYRSDKEREEGLKALRSFMVLSFLPHQSGRGRVVSERNIADGPRVFAQVIQNWQLVSARVASQCGSRRIPTVRYVPQQATGNGAQMDSELSGKASAYEQREAMRNLKTCRRY